MRVLHCIPSLGIGGAERQIVYLSSLLPRHGWEVHLATFGGGAFEARLAPGTQVHRVRSTSNYDPRNVLRLAQIIRRVRPALVQSWLSQMDVLAGAASLLCGVPWIISERSSALAHPRGWRSSLRELLGRNAAGIIANSAGGLQFWSERSRKCTLRQVIPNAISIDAPPRRGPSAEPQVVFVGRLSPEKRISPLLRALAVVHGDVPVKAVICGDGPLASELRAESVQLGLNGVVEFRGFVDDVPAIMSSADVVVSLSRFEGLPNSVQEAVMCGTPLVLSDIPAHRDLLDDQSALFVDGDDPADVARAITATLLDRDAARRRADAALRVAQRWSPGAVAAAYDSFYHQVLEVH